MKIIFDNDGTLTDFTKWVYEKAVPYFEKKYGMSVVYEYELEIEDIMDMKNFLISKYNLTEEEALIKQKAILDEFWCSLKFLDFALLNPFRDGFAKYIKKATDMGHEVYIYSSRAKTCNNDLIGSIARKLTILQYRINGIHLNADNFVFFPNDREKINAIIDAKPSVVFDDKPEIINKLNKNNIKTICVSGKHNVLEDDTAYNKRLSEFNEDNINNIVENVIGKKNLECLNNSAKSQMFYEKLFLIKDTVLKKYKPIILHEENLIKDSSEGLVYVSNHLKTIDPLIITSIIDENIHWLALKRFFKNEDSIFNISKNPVLC